MAQTIIHCQLAVHFLFAGSLILSQQRRLFGRRRMLLDGGHFLCMVCLPVKDGGGGSGGQADACEESGVGHQKDTEPQHAGGHQHTSAACNGGMREFSRWL
jgi:hypothetical protein